MCRIKWRQFKISVIGVNIITRLEEHKRFLIDASKSRMRIDTVGVLIRKCLLILCIIIILLYYNFNFEMTSA